MFDSLTFGKLAKWSGFLGVFLIIMGVLQAVTIVGIPMAILMIIMGVKLIGAKNAAKALAVTGEMEAPAQVNKLANDLRVFFQINSVLIIIGLVLGVLMGVGLIIFIVIQGGIPEFNYDFNF